MSKTLPVDSAREPRAERPHMPGYGIAEEPAGVLPWDWATERLARSRCYWLASRRPGGAPHVMPVWGIWRGDAFVFGTSPTSRKARNLRASPDCVVTTEDPLEPVILEGLAVPVETASELATYVEAYRAKYDWTPTPADEAILAVRPERVFGFLEDAAEFGRSATRWRFGG